MKHPPLLKKLIALSLTLLSALVILLSTTGSASAQENSISSGRIVPIASSQKQGPTDPAELGAFLDGLLGREMEENHIPGAAVSVVKDGKLFFAKGYGYADLENRIPVDPEQTVFRIGSVGKTFTWTAVMQLVEQGKLNLDADVNTYLDFRIPDTYPQPITLKHLMTHTSGFEDRLRESVVSNVDDLVSAREWLVSHMSARVSPPGAFASYANYNAMLAGYIVARVSGEPYDQYVQTHILDPLGMVHTTARSQIPPDLRAHASVGYTYANGVFHAFPDYIAQPALMPSGGHQASVTDMARFMIAHLQNGRYGDSKTAETRILKESTAQQMHSTLYTPDSRLLGTAYGFFDFSDNGQRTLGHTGYSPPMHSVLLLLPDQNLGVYVVYNSESAGELVNQHMGFQRAFFDHYYPAPVVAPVQPQVEYAERASRFEGSYRVSQGSYTTIDKVGLLFQTVDISDPGNGTLVLTISGQEFQFAQMTPQYFHQVDGPFGLLFSEDDRGQITRMFTDMTPMWSFKKLDWYETFGFNIALVVGCVLLFLSIIPVAAIRFIRNRRQGGNWKPASSGARIALWIIMGICVLNLLFVVGTALWGMQPNVLAGTSLMGKIVLGVGVLSAVLTIAALVYTVLAWNNSYWGIAARVYYTVVTSGAVAFIWFLNSWNLLGWRL